MGVKPQEKRWLLGVLTVAFTAIISLNFLTLGILITDPFQALAVDIPPPPREYLRQQCEVTGCDFALLDTIVTCESGWRMVKNARSSAYGYFQIIDGTERTTPQYAEGERKFDPYTNIDMGLYLYEERGTNPWNSSRGCWQHKYWQAKAATVAAE